jgi:hypothetical protein
MIVEICDERGFEIVWERLLRELALSGGPGGHRGDVPGRKIDREREIKSRTEGTAGGKDAVGDWNPMAMVQRGRQKFSVRETVKWYVPSELVARRERRLRESEVGVAGKSCKESRGVRSGSELQGDSGRQGRHERDAREVCEEARNAAREEVPSGPGKEELSAE